MDLNGDPVKYKPWEPFLFLGDGDCAGLSGDQAYWTDYDCDISENFPVCVFQVLEESEELCCTDDYPTQQCSPSLWLMLEKSKTIVAEDYIVALNSAGFYTHTNIKWSCRNYV